MLLRGRSSRLLQAETRHRISRPVRGREIPETTRQRPFVFWATYLPEDADRPFLDPTAPRETGILQGRVSHGYIARNARMLTRFAGSTFEDQSRLRQAHCGTCATDRMLALLCSRQLSVLASGKGRPRK